MSEEYEISIVFGGDKEASVNRTFQTQREMHAYFCALHDSDGWLDYTYVEDGIDGWVYQSDGTWKQENDEYTIETYNQKSVSYPEFAKGQNDKEQE
tara:strand:- start:466 stop:753 length:288 start_codon:yes stop_codon:yes gene_type:complete